MILDLQLDTSRLSRNYKSTDDFTLHPYLATFTDYDAVRINPVKVLPELFDDVYWFLVGHQLLLALPEHSDTCPNLVA